MPNLYTSEAAARLGVTVHQFHRLAARHNIIHIDQAPGVRGVKQWAETDIEQLAEELAA